MEYREHPRNAAETRLEGMADDPDSRPRFRRFEFRRPARQLDVPRILLASLFLLAAVSMVGYLGLQASRSAVRWLHYQPEYQIPFSSIRLRPEPPPWFRGGAEAFLKQVRERASEPEILPVLELESGRLRRAFQDYCPWVEEVVRISFPPQEILVELVYKQPVAAQPLSGGGELYLDRNGHLLPGEDIDLEAIDSLVRITGQQLIPSPANRPGGVWKSGVQGAEADRLERCMRGATALAGFLREPSRRTESASLPALNVVSIFATDPRGLFLQTEEGVQVLWGVSLSKGTTGDLDDSEKWEILKNWAKSNTRRKLAHRGYWTFGRSELRPIEPSTSRS